MHGTWVLSHFSCVQLFVTLWTVTHQALLSMGFSRQECWSGWSCPPPGSSWPRDLVHWQASSLPLAPPGKPLMHGFLLLFSHSVVSPSLQPHGPTHQGSLSFTISQSLLKLMSIESVMASNHLVLCLPLLLLPSIFPSIRVSSNESALCVRWPQSIGVSTSASVLLKGCCWITRIHQDSWLPEEKNSIWGQRQGLIAQSFCVIKFY